MSNEIQQIIEQFYTPEGFPEKALRDARQFKAEIIPALIEVIERAAAHVQNGETVEDYAHFFALFLLGEFRAREALPAIIRAVSLPGEKPFDLFGDGIHEGLPKTLAGIAGPDNPDAVLALLYDTQVNEYVRWAAAKSLAKMVHGKLQDRSQVIAWLRQALRTAIERADAQVCSGLIESFLDLDPDEVYDEIRDAYASNLADESVFGDFADIKKEIERGQTRDISDSPFIEDCIEELKGWPAFAEPDMVETSDLDEEVGAGLDWSPTKLPTRIPAPLMHEQQPPLQPVRHERPRVGRNDPCPCGSGKKFKKCCGG